LAASDTNGLGAGFVSNCGITTAIDIGKVVSVATKVMELVNAVELTWTLPYEIPEDRTEAHVTCKTEQSSDGNNAATYWSKDPLQII